VRDVATERHKRKCDWGIQSGAETKTDTIIRNMFIIRLLYQCICMQAYKLYACCSLSHNKHASRQTPIPQEGK
jgi:hypothetical protein